MAAKDELGRRGEDLGTRRKLRRLGALYLNEHREVTKDFPLVRFEVNG